MCRFARNSITRPSLLAAAPSQALVSANTPRLRFPEFHALIIRSRLGNWIEQAEEMRNRRLILGHGAGNALLGAAPTMVGRPIEEGLIFADFE
jgi:hypothetical protein